MRIVLELLEENILNNAKVIYEYAKKPIIGVVKANAYGMGSIEVSSVLEKSPYVKAFAVACVEEGIELRQNTVEKPILILGGVLSKEELFYAKEHSLTPVISTPQGFELLKDENINFHIKIDTGMGRLGFFDIPEYILNHPHLKGIMTHLASPLNQEYSYMQISKFKSLINRAKDFEIHLQSSAGLLYNLDFTTSVRIGLALYGEKPYDQFVPPIKPIYRLKAKVISLKAFKKGDKISYGGTYTIPKDACVGVVSMGYADGIPKQLSSKWFFDFKSAKLPIIGAITMDMTMFELPENVNINVGDWVEFVNENQTFSMASKLLKTIPYELMCRIGKRVQRKLVRR